MFFFFSSRRRHTRCSRDWSSDVCSSDLWQELLRLREWNDAADTLIGFAFRCAGGRVGIVTMLSPARPGLPDTPLHYVILPEEEGNSLQALIPPEKWHPLRSTSDRKSVV